MSTKKTYSEKLKDPRWQKKRLEVLRRAKFKCELCGDSETELHVHHKNYETGFEPWEYNLNNFQCLCKVCHYQVERYKGAQATPLKIHKFKVDERFSRLVILGKKGTAIRIEVTFYDDLVDDKTPSTISGLGEEEIKVICSFLKTKKRMGVQNG